MILARVKLKAHIDDGGVPQELEVEAPRAAVPYASAALLTALAGDVREHLQTSGLPKAFDRPTDFTLRGVYVKRATKDQMEAEVYFPDSDDERGKSRREYLRPGAKGGRRHQKKTEFLLSRIGALPAGWVATPGKGAQLDAHGNLAGSVYRQIINVLQIRYNNLKPVSGRSQKAAQRLGVDSLFFVIVPGPNKLGRNGSWLPPGVWKHLPGGQISQILKFVRAATYRQRIDLTAEAKQVVEAKLQQRAPEVWAMISERFAANRKARG